MYRRTGGHPPAIATRTRRHVALLVSVGILFMGTITAAPTSAQDAAPPIDPCAIEEETPPPPPDYPGPPDATPPPPPVSPEDIAAEAAEAARVEAEQVAFVEERLAAIEAGLGPDPDATPPPPPVSPEDCDTSYRVVEIPGVRSWSGSCIDSLAEGPIILKWKGGTENGVFTLRPSSETGGAITEVLNGKQPGFTFKYQGKGRYRIEVVEQNQDGSPRLLDVVYATKGKAKQCVAGTCVTSTIAGGEAMIPLEAHGGSCPRGD